LVSLFVGRKVRCDIAMTGELSLQGLALPVGGIKDKCMAAHRNGIYYILLPKQNEKDVSDIPEDLRKQLKFKFCTHVNDYIEEALEKNYDKKYLYQTRENFRIVSGSKRVSIKELEPKM
jgi:ATP-dependent Lon protease